MVWVPGLNDRLRHGQKRGHGRLDPRARLVIASGDLSNPTGNETMLERQKFDPEANRGLAKKLRVALSVASYAFLPMAVLALLGEHYRALFAGIPLQTLTNLSATKQMFSDFMHGSLADDSWYAMIRALHVLAGPLKNSLYETL